jgi:hypothetical protein
MCGRFRTDVTAGLAASRLDVSAMMCSLESLRASVSCFSSVSTCAAPHHAPRACSLITYMDRLGPSRVRPRCPSQMSGTGPAGEGAVNGEKDSSQRTRGRGGWVGSLEASAPHSRGAKRWGKEGPAHTFDVSTTASAMMTLRSLDLSAASAAVSAFSSKMSTCCTCTRVHAYHRTVHWTGMRTESMPASPCGHRSFLKVCGNPLSSPP